MSAQPRVLIVEDEPAIAELIEVNLRHNGFQTERAADAKSARAAVAQAAPDVILLDWMLADDSGLNLARAWRTHPATQAVPILMLTARGSEADRVAGLDVGADDYIVKPFSPRELLARIHAVLRRRAPQLGQHTFALGALQLDASTHRVSWQGQGLKLGPTEFKLLHCLMRAPERVHSRQRLLDQVWGDQVIVEERTVDVHVKRLREALGLAAPMLETVRGAGYRLTAAAQPPTAASGGG